MIVHCSEECFDMEGGDKLRLLPWLREPGSFYTGGLGSGLAILKPSIAVD